MGLRGGAGLGWARQQGGARFRPSVAAPSSLPRQGLPGYRGRETGVRHTRLQREFDALGVGASAFSRAAQLPYPESHLGAALLALLQYERYFKFDLAEIESNRVSGTDRHRLFQLTAQVTDDIGQFDHWSPQR
jgi:hypothetical protein